MTSTFTPNKSLEEPGYNDYVNSWNTPVNANSSAIDQALGGVTEVNVTGQSGTIVLTLSQYRPLNIYVAGTPSGDITLQFPAGVGGMWVVTNATSGSHTLTFSGVTAGVTIPQGIVDTIFNDGGTGYTFRTTPSGQPGGSDTQVQFNNSGAFAGSSNLTFREVAGVGLIVGSGTNPGFGGGAGTRLATTGQIGTASDGATDGITVQKDSTSGTFLKFNYGSLSATPTVVGSVTYDGTTLSFNGTATTALNANYATSAGSAAAALVATTATNVTNLTSAQVGTATAGLSAGAVGTYAMAKYLGSGAITFGGTVSGNLLVPCDATGTIVGSPFSAGQTWQCMGRVDTVSFETLYNVTSWLRVS
jgi:hypothetical protein